MDKLGYCCINSQLRARGIYTSRSMIKRTFDLDTASERALQNCRDLLTILQWNLDNDIYVFRISSELFPRYTCKAHGYQFTSLKDHLEIAETLAACGEFAHQHDMSLHPGPFTTLASPNPDAMAGGIKEVEYHSSLCDLIDPNNKLDIPINFHVGGSYDRTFEATAHRFWDAFERLSESAQRRVVIENDDRPSGWDVQLLHKFIYLALGVPITFDFHHWHFCKMHGADMYQDFRLAESTWGSRSMQVHYSESRDPDKLIPAHSDYYQSTLPDYVDIQGNYHIHLEAKMKEQALFSYRQNECAYSR